jgi:hypothetical protein
MTTHHEAGQPLLAAALILLGQQLQQAAAQAATPAGATTPPDPDATGSGVLFTSVAGGALTVLVVCTVICYADRRSLKEKYEIRALEAEQRGLGSPAGGGGASDDGDEEHGGRGGGPVYGTRDAEETGFSGALLDVGGEAFDAGISPANGLAGTKLSGDLEYLRALPDLRMPRLPGIRAVVEIDGAEVSFKPGEETMRQATTGSVGRGALDHAGRGIGGGGSSRSSSVASGQTVSDMS